jgi:5-methyltetrahydrofolate--homocysteine methyltransferase
MELLEYLNSNLLYLDGGMGTLLQKRGLSAGELPERWNITHPDVIVDIHRAYLDSGSNVISTNTFGANRLKFSASELDLIIRSAVENARLAISQSKQNNAFVALDIGPTGKMLRPYGELDFEDAVSVFSEVVELGVKYGVDLIYIETMNDSYETKAALLAAKESSSLPVFVSNAYGEDGKLMTGASPLAMIALLEGMGADAIGVNCSLGPSALAPIVREYLKYSSLPVLMKANAGLPAVIDGKTVFDVSAEEFAAEVSALVKEGVRIIGGCCGTTPEYISALKSCTQGITPIAVEKKNISVVSSYSRAVLFGERPVLIGERINPTGKKRFKEALRSGDVDYILNEGISQEEKGAQILDVNVGLPEIDEVQMLRSVVCELQAVTSLPLQIDTSDAFAMEAALRRYNGKAMINSVNGKPESMAAVFPLVKKYGGLVVALTLDENGIPATAEGRLDIARRILCEAERCGISKNDIIFDPLALTVSADDRAAVETLRSIELISSELGCLTSLGVSNVSFGLPSRETVTATFFTMAMTKGLSAAIMNPYSLDMQKAYRSFLALSGLDSACSEYIEFASSMPAQSVVSVASDAPKETEVYKSELQRAIIKGLREEAARLTSELISSSSAPLDVVQNEIIPALDTVGIGFEKKTVYLPSLLMSAEAAKSAFEVIKANMPGERGNKATVVIATVKGDIHDIGKNIVRLLLENYGFNVIDLGRDVAPSVIAAKAAELNASVVALSALMTTTVPAMEETIKLVRVSAPNAKIIVGGAVLTQEYADMIGADKYAKDAMGAVRYAESICL